MNASCKNRLSSLLRNFQIIREFIPFVFFQGKGKGWRFSAVLALILITIALNISIPLLLKQVIASMSDATLMTRENVFFLLLAYGFLWTFSRITTSLREITTFRTAELSVRLLCLRIFDHLHVLSLNFHLERQAGAITTAIDRAQRAFPVVFWGFIFFILPTSIEVLIATFILWNLYDITYGITLLIILISYLLFSTLASKWTIDAQEASNKKCLKASAYVVDSLINFETVKYLGGYIYEHNRCNKVLKEREDAQTRKNVLLEIVCICQGLIVGIGLTILVWMTGKSVYLKTLEPSDFVLINGYLIQFFTPLSFFGLILRDMRKGFSDMKNVSDILQLTPEITDAPNAVNLNSQEVSVCFHNVTFAYEKNRTVLKGISFKIPFGKTVAIVGPTGSGKSTIARLLFRLYDVTDGQIFINDTDIRDVKLASLQKLIGVVPQDIVLFNDTIHNNISYPFPDTPIEEVQRSAEISGLHEFVMKLPEGYSTIVGERGLKLSGGEKQRMSIARVLLKKPAIYIFDEATSSLDVQTEQNIQKNIEKISHYSTSLIIAHRLSTIIDADEIIVLENGLIEERGDHHSLLEKGGLYSRLWAIQSQKNSVLNCQA